MMLLRTLTLLAAAPAAQAHFDLIHELNKQEYSEGEKCFFPKSAEKVEEKLRGTLPQVRRRQLYSPGPPTERLEIRLCKPGLVCDHEKTGTCVTDTRPGLNTPCERAVGCQAFVTTDEAGRIPLLQFGHRVPMSCVPTSTSTGTSTSTSGCGQTEEFVCRQPGHYGDTCRFTDSSTGTEHWTPCAIGFLCAGYGPHIGKCIESKFLEFFPESKVRVADGEVCYTQEQRDEFQKTSSGGPIDERCAAGASCTLSSQKETLEGSPLRCVMQTEKRKEGEACAWPCNDKLKHGCYFMERYVPGCAEGLVCGEPETVGTDQPPAKVRTCVPSTL
jgi:hypothetical protein